MHREGCFAAFTVNVIIVDPGVLTLDHAGVRFHFEDLRMRIGQVVRDGMFAPLYIKLSGVSRFSEEKGTDCL